MFAVVIPKGTQWHHCLAVLAGRRMASDGEGLVQIVVVVVGIKFRSGDGDHCDLALIDESMTGDRSPVRR